MGVDKADVVFGGRTMLQRSIDTLSRAGCSPVLVLHRRPEDLDSVGVAIRRDLGGGEGPLDGLVSALAIAETPVVVTLPVDLPLIGGDDVRRLIGELERILQRGMDLDAVALADDSDSRQHLAAAWRRDRCLEALRRSFDDGERSVHRAISGFAMAWIRVPAGRLLNVNTPDDLASGGEPTTSL
jgi:molybdopterin-guanine dinucleotide biosynthesis protein A